MKRPILFSFVPVLNMAVMPDLKDVDLSGMKDVILGEKPSIFPLSIGWWIVLILLCLGVFAFVWYIKWRFFPTPRVYALRELEDLKKQNLSMVEIGSELSKLLKRVAILKYGRENVASLTDTEWGTFLNEKGNNIFSKKELNFIQKVAWMPPQKEIAISKDSLYNHTKEWIKYILKGC